MNKKRIFRIFSALVFLFLAFSCGTDLNTEPELPDLKILSPAEGTEWRIGSEYLIEWVNNTGRAVTIDLMSDVEKILTIGTFAHMMSEYSFVLPDTTELGSGYILKIFVADDHAISDSGRSFNIIEKLNIIPEIRITKPRDGKYINSGNTVHVEVDAKDEDGFVVCVKYYVNDEFAGESFEAPFNFTLPTYNTTAGLYSISAVAVDNRDSLSAVSSINVVITDGTEDIELVRVPTGNFMMGSLSGDYDEKPVNLVYITNDYYIGKYTITNSQYAEMLNFALEQGELTGDYQNNVTVMNLNGTQKELIRLSNQSCEVEYNGSFFQAKTGKENRPVSTLSWRGAAFYGNMTSRKMNLQELYDLESWTCDFEGTGYRLPTEAEWEYAAKYNDGRKYPWGNYDPDPSICNYGVNVGHSTEKGLYSPKGDSALGLCDMAGNLWEWVNDWYGYYPNYAGFLVNPTGPPGGSLKVLRGGSYNGSEYYIRTTYRNVHSPTSGTLNSMRIVLSIN